MVSPAPSAARKLVQLVAMDDSTPCSRLVYKKKEVNFSPSEGAATLFRPSEKNTRQWREEAETCGQSTSQLDAHSNTRAINTRLMPATEGT